MTPPDVDPEGTPSRDPELGRLLEEWTVPALPDTLDRRVLDSYRTQVGRAPLWQRFFTTSLRVPLPVAVALLLILALAFWVPRRKPEPPMETSEPLAGPRTAQVQVHASAIPVSGSLAGFEPVREMNVTVLSSDATQ
jgi:hypothetical protein